jgi:hypothetical protein
VSARGREGELQEPILMDTRGRLYLGTTTRKFVTEILLLYPIKQ